MNATEYVSKSWKEPVAFWDEDLVRAEFPHDYVLVITLNISDIIFMSAFKHIKIDV